MKRLNEILLQSRISRTFRLLKLVYIAWREVGFDKLTMILTVAAGENKKSDSLRELEKVSNFIGIPSDVLQVKTRKRDIVEARQVAMYLAKRNTKESLAQIGSNIGRKDHATVLHACKTVENLIETDRSFRDKWMPLLTAQ